MKRFCLVFLTFAVLLGNMAMLAIGVSAEAVVETLQNDYQEPSGLYLINAEQISASTTSGTVGTTVTGAWSGQKGTMDWSVIPLNGFLGFQPSQIIESGVLEIVGEFPKPTTVSCFSVLTVKNRDRFSNVIFSFSRDGENWDQAIVTADRSAHAAASVVLTYTMPSEYSEKEYQYVKITRDPSTVYLVWGGVKFYSKTMQSVPVQDISNAVPMESYSRAADVSVIPVSIQSTNVTYGSIGGDNSGVWVGKDGSLDWTGVSLSALRPYFTSQCIRTNGENKNEFKIIGKFDAPSTVNGFAAVLPQTSRFLNVTVAFSADAINWVTVVTTAANSWSGSGTLVVRFTVPEEYANTEFNYVKIERESDAPETNTGTWTQVGGFEFYTTKKDDNCVVVDYQDGNKVRFFGRTYSEGDTHFFNWSASGFTFNFKGSGAKATVVSKCNGGRYTGYLKIYVDGVEMPDVRLDGLINDVVLASDLDPEKEHTIKVLKRSSAAWNTAGLISLTLLDGGEIKNPPPAKDKLIEFIGDSITVGYSTVAGDATEWSTATEDPTKTYAEQIATALDADYIVTAISGRGIVRNSGGGTDKPFSEIYPKLDIYNNPNAEYDFAVQPDLIIINLGTNDASGNNADLTATEFRIGLMAFLKMVREKNPNAEILYTYGLMTTKYTDDMTDVVTALNQEGDDKISFLPLKQCSAAEKQIGHPTAEAYVSRGEAIIAKVNEIMNDNTSNQKPQPTTPPDDTEISTADTSLALPDDTGTADINQTTEPDKRGCASSITFSSIAMLMGCTVFFCKRRKVDD